MRSQPRTWLTILAAALLIGILTPASSAGAPAPPTDPWAASQVVQPAALAHALAAKAGAKPLVICVGFSVLYQGGHIAGARYAGPASSAAGRAALRRLVQPLPRGKAIVLYCGCCPWAMCPNIRPAFSLLKRLGFTNVKVLHMAQNFRTDWGARGYAMQHGAGSR